MNAEPDPAVGLRWKRVPSERFKQPPHQEMDYSRDQPQAIGEQTLAHRALVKRINSANTRIGDICKPAEFRNRW